MTPQELLLAGQDALNRGDFAEAVATFTELTRLAPNATVAWCGRSAAYFGAEDYAKALAAAHRARELSPGDQRALLVLGPAAFISAEQAMIDACRRQLAELPKDAALSTAQFWVSRLTEKDYFIEASLAFEAFALGHLDDTTVALELTHHYLNAFRVDDAIAILDGLIARGVRDARIEALYARGFVTKGEIEKAKTAAQKAIDIDRDCVAGYVMIAEIDPSLITPSIDAHLSSLIERGDISRDNKIVALLALGRAREKRGEFDTAFSAFKQANESAAAALAQSGLVYDRRVREANVAETIVRYSAPSAPRCDRSSTQGNIFIIGMPRSGSTLIDQALSRHSSISSVGESRIIPSIANQATRTADADGRTFRDAISDFKASYEAAYGAAADGAQIVIDKNLFNFEHCGLITDLDPNARFIVALREPADIALSIFKIRFLAAMPWSNDLGDIAHMQASFEHLVDHWLRTMGDRIHLVKHEEFVADFEAGVRNLLDFCGLEFEPQCLAFHEGDRRVYTTSASQVRRPINADGVGRWKQYERHLGSYFQSLEDSRRCFANQLQSPRRNH
ncbi:MAG: sulfotransferase [Parvularculaceae bacterium]